MISILTCQHRASRGPVGENQSSRTISPFMRRRSLCVAAFDARVRAVVAQVPACGRVPDTPVPLQVTSCASHLRAASMWAIARDDEMPGAHPIVARSAFDPAPFPKELLEIEGGPLWAPLSPGRHLRPGQRHPGRVPRAPPLKVTMAQALRSPTPVGRGGVSSPLFEVIDRALPVRLGSASVSRASQATDTGAQHPVCEWGGGFQPASVSCAEPSGDRCNHVHGRGREGAREQGR